MRRPVLRVTAAGLLAAVLAGCSLLTDLAGLSGGAEPCAGGACVDARAFEGGGESGAADGAPGDAADAKACDPGDASVDPTLLTDVVALAPGLDFTCALRASGTVVCWGENAFDQLGAPGASRSTPATVSGLSGVTAIAAGDNFACALTAAGEVWCWGQNLDGQLGTGTAEAGAHLPAKVRASATKTLSGVVAIGAGARHACAATGGALVCWGANDKLQLGHAGAGLVPSAVAGITNPVELAIFGDYSCAVSDDPSATAPKALSCWGSNADYQLGNQGPNTAAPQRIALRIAASGPYPIAAAGWGHACARDESSALWCGGETDYGQLGPGVSPGPSVAALQKMTAFGTVRTMAPGDDFTCVVGTDGKVRCLGENNLAQLGNGTIDVPIDGGGTPAHTTGTLVSGLPAVERVAASTNHACAIVAHPCPATGGAVLCWGDNGDGQLGNGSSNPTKVAVAVVSP